MRTETEPPVITAGAAEPQGATLTTDGLNVAVTSHSAHRIDLCLFDIDGVETRLVLPGRTGSTFHGHVVGIGPGQRYGFRVHGPWQPDRGLRANPHKLLLDPYAKAVTGSVRWDDAVLDHQPDNVLALSTLDSAHSVPHSLVVDPTFDWGGDESPRTPWARTVIYEAHVRGLTRCHPDVPGELRGTYTAVAHPAIIEHLQSLGVTAIELLPVHEYVNDRRLVGAGLDQFWGYNSVAYFAPHHAYSAGAPGAQVAEFKTMVKALHAAGIEVFLDVVYNHTGEGDLSGPSLGFRGLDNAVAYRLDPPDSATYLDITGTGNTVQITHPTMRRLVLDSLRYWAAEMHVDGFRFDLAAALGRDPISFDAAATFFAELHADETLHAVKLIAEPWDLGDHGYQLGAFPSPWAEWNGRFRDHTRDFWRMAPTASSVTMTDRLDGSADIFDTNGRAPWASVNFVTCHDGFTLADLVSYDHKHNADNGEDGRDGTDDNRSDNLGVEGPTDDASIMTRRRRRQRNLLASVLLATGVPMLTAGDEIGRTQQGNNNAYCQDNEISWIDWENADCELLAFTRELAALRASCPEAWPTRWHRERTDPALPYVALRREERGDDGIVRVLLVLANPAADPIPVPLPAPPAGARWQVALDTGSADGRHAGSHATVEDDRIEVPGETLIALRSRWRSDVSDAPPN